VSTVLLTTAVALHQCTAYTAGEYSPSHPSSGTTPVHSIYSRWVQSFSPQQWHYTRTQHIQQVSTVLLTTAVALYQNTAYTAGEYSPTHHSSGTIPVHCVYSRWVQSFSPQQWHYTSTLRIQQVSTVLLTTAVALHQYTAYTAGEYSLSHHSSGPIPVHSIYSRWVQSFSPQQWHYTSTQHIQQVIIVLLTTTVTPHQYTAYTAGDYSPAHHNSDTTPVHSIYSRWVQSYSPQQRHNTITQDSIFEYSTKVESFFVIYSSFSFLYL
jgi:hypothetical protein